MILLAFPCISYTWVTIHDMTYQTGKLTQANTMLDNKKGLVHVSNLISVVQIERGTSAVFLKSKGGMDIAKLNAKRANTDSKIPAVKKFLEEFSDKEASKLGLEKINALTELRKSVENNAPVGQIVSEYTSIVTGMMKVIESASYQANPYISSKLRGVLLLESARENAGLLRANLSGALAADMPVDDEILSKLIGFKSGVDTSLKSPALDLSDKLHNQIKDNFNKEHWQKVTEVLNNVIANASEGGFGEDGQEFFATATKQVDDIGMLIKEDLVEIESSAQKFKDDAVLSLSIISIEVLINTILIIVVLIYSLKNIKNFISTLIKRMQSANANVSETTSKLTQSSQELSSSSQETAAAIQETVSTMSEMNSMVSRTLDKSKEAKNASDKINNQIEDASSIVTNMSNSMDALAESNKQLEGVTKVISSIAKQTGVINDIVFKTQLLAVNASIEAAKAGVHGKGFAVVADEVSKLAQLSGESAAKISDLLESSEEQVTEIITDVSKRVEKGNENAQAVRSAFEDISVEVNEIKNLSEDMAHASEEQSLGIEQITSAIAQIDEATQANTAEAQAVETSAEILVSNSKGLQNITHNMSLSLLGKNHELTMNIDSDSGDFSTTDSDVNEDNLANLHAINSDEGSNHSNKADASADDDSFRPAS